MFGMPNTLRRERIRSLLKLADGSEYHAPGGEPVVLNHPEFAR